MEYVNYFYLKYHLQMIIVNLWSASLDSTMPLDDAFAIQLFTKKYTIDVLLMCSKIIYLFIFRSYAITQVSMVKFT